MSDVIRNMVVFNCINFSGGVSLGLVRFYMDKIEILIAVTPNTYETDEFYKYEITDPELVNYPAKIFAAIKYARPIHYLIIEDANILQHSILFRNENKDLLNEADVLAAISNAKNILIPLMSATTISYSMNIPERMLIASYHNINIYKGFLASQQISYDGTFCSIRDELKNMQDEIHSLKKQVRDLTKIIYTPGNIGAKQAAESFYKSLQERPQL